MKTATTAENRLTGYRHQKNLKSLWQATCPSVTAATLITDYCGPIFHTTLSLVKNAPLNSIFHPPSKKLRVKDPRLDKRYNQQVNSELKKAGLIKLAFDLQRKAENNWDTMMETEYNKIQALRTLGSEETWKVDFEDLK
jgi:hypothetical protein